MTDGLSNQSLILCSLNFKNFWYLFYCNNSLWTAQFIPPNTPCPYPRHRHPGLLWIPVPTHRRPCQPHGARSFQQFCLNLYAYCLLNWFKILQHVSIFVNYIMLMETFVLPSKKPLPTASLMCISWGCGLVLQFLHTYLVLAHKTFVHGEIRLVVASKNKIFGC